MMDQLLLSVARPGPSLHIPTSLPVLQLMLPLNPLDIPLHKSFADFPLPDASLHMQVGKGYLYLSRVYQLQATSAPEYYSKAQQALTHAYEICYAGQVTPKVPGSTA